MVKEYITNELQDMCNYLSDPLFDIDMTEISMKEYVPDNDEDENTFGMECHMFGLIEGRLMSRYIRILESQDKTLYTDGIDNGREILSRQYQEMTNKQWDGKLDSYNKAIDVIGHRLSGDNSFDWDGIVKDVNEYDGAEYGFDEEPLTGIVESESYAAIPFDELPVEKMLERAEKDGSWSASRNASINKHLRLTGECVAAGYYDADDYRKELLGDIKLLADKGNQIDGLYITKYTANKLQKLGSDIAFDGIDVRGDKSRKLPSVEINFEDDGKEMDMECD